jgi:phosphate transport system substrate-binding protein
MNPCSAGLVGAFLACSTIAVHAQAIRLESSSAAHPLSQRIAEDFTAAGGKVKLALGDSGSAEALRRLCAGEADLAAVSRPIVKVELAQCAKAERTFVEVPIAFDALAVIVNPRNSFLSALSVDELRTVWAAEAQGKVVRWSQLNSRYPDQPLKLYAPDPRAERGNYFNEAILGAGREARRDFSASADDDVIVQAVARDADALGYVPLSYYTANRKRLKAVPIARAAGDAAAEPSLESIAAGRYQPLSRPLFLYVSVKSLEKAEVAAFAEHYVQQVRRLARELNYVPLADATYQVAQERLAKRTPGSRWDGAVPVGVTLESLHKRFAAL